LNVLRVISLVAVAMPDMKDAIPAEMMDGMHRLRLLMVKT
jgi:hypothetical protein